MPTGARVLYCKKPKIIKTILIFQYMVKYMSTYLFQSIQSIIYIGLIILPFFVLTFQ